MRRRKFKNSRRFQGGFYKKMIPGGPTTFQEISRSFPGGGHPENGLLSCGKYSFSAAAHLSLQRLGGRLLDKQQRIKINQCIDKFKNQTSDKKFSMSTNF